VTDPVISDDSGPIVEAFLKQAEIARQKLAWDDVVKIFQIALKQIPGNRSLRRGLAAAYVSKADRMSFRPFYHHAMEEYWRLVNSDPKDEQAHDGLLTAAVKADQLGEVMEEYRARLARGTEVECYRAAFKKIQALYFLRAEPQRDAPSSTDYFKFVFGRVAPIVSLVCLIAWVILRVKIGPQPDMASPKMLAFATFFIRTGIFTFLVSLVYYALRIIRSSK
jgi:tetratricopeptide (TPR) repeat protein